MTCDSKTFTISDPTRTGYTFDGWTVVGDGITQTDNGTSTTFTKNQAGNMTITANWTPIPYKQIVKVRYQNADGTWGIYSDVINANYNYGSTVSWSRAADATYKAASISYTVTGANTKYISVYRNWDEAITKSEVITLFIDAAEVYYNTTKSTSTTADDNIVVDDTTSSFEIVAQGDYPDSRSDHQANWDIYKNYFDDFSVYGTDTAGKGLNDLPYGGDTGYDPKGTILQERTTDKGYTVMYDTDTGKVYYSSMILPTGDVYLETESGGVLATYAYAKGYNNCYDITYDEMQEILGVYNGD